MVLFFTTLIAILGATTLIMAAYSMINAQSSMPAAKAFDVAEAGISAAHAQIVTETVQASHTYTDLAGGTCLVQISGSDPRLAVTSTGTYRTGRAEPTSARSRNSSPTRARTVSASCRITSSTRAAISISALTILSTFGSTHHHQLET